MKCRRLRAANLRLDLREAISYAVNVSAPRALIKQLEVADGSLEYWSELADGSKLASAIDETERLLSEWSSWRCARR